MTIIAYTPTPMGDAVEVEATSDLSGDVYWHWYQDGAYVGMSTTGIWTLYLQDGEQVDLVAQDTTDPDYDPIANAPTGYPARRTLYWTRSTDADVERYRIKEDVDGGGYTIVGEVLQGDEWEHRWLTERLTDLATYTWQIVPLDAAGNEGTAKVLGPEKVVRKPDAPAFSVAFDGGTTRVTFSSA